MIKVTETLRISIGAPFEQVADDLADPMNHPQWATEFFQGPAARVDAYEVAVQIPALGGAARFKVEADIERGCFELYVAPQGAPFGDPLPVRLVRTADGVDVLWTLERMPHMDDAAWTAGLAAM
jgi:hypothetical protein